MIHLIRWELAKLYRRLTPYTVYGVIVFLVCLIVLAFKFDHDHHGLRRHASEGFELVGNPINGVLICQVVLESIARLLPFMVLLACGEILGIEGGTGTLRTLLTRPRSRVAIYLAKFVTAFLYTLSCCLFMYAFSLLLGTAVFGRGQLWEWNAMLHGKLLVLSEREAILSLSLSYLQLSVAVFVTGALALMLGAFFDSGLAPGFTALCIVVIVQVVAVLQFDWVETIRPYLFTTFLMQYSEVMPHDFDPVTMELIVPVDTLVESLRGCAVYIAVFGGIGLWRFARRDVTC